MGRSTADGVSENARFSRSYEVISRKLEGRSEVVREDRALETKANTQDLQPWCGTHYTQLPGPSHINHPQANLVVAFSQLRLPFAKYL